LDLLQSNFISADRKLGLIDQRNGKTFERNHEN